MLSLYFYVGIMFLNLLKLHFANIDKASFIFPFYTWSDFQCHCEKDGTLFFKNVFRSGFIMIIKIL